MSEVAENVFEEVDPIETAEANEDSQVKESKEKKLEIPEAVEAAFVGGKNADCDEDKIYLTMLQAGCPFKSVKRFYDALMVQYGLAISREDQESVVKSAIEGLDISVESDFDSAVNAINSQISFINEKESANALRSYARKNDIEYFRKPKGPRSVRGLFLESLYDGLYENPFMTKEDLDELIAKQNSDVVTKTSAAYQKIRELCNRIAAKYTVNT